MRFSLRHHFGASVERVEQAILDPGFQARLAHLPKLAERKVTEQAEQPDGTVRRVTFYRFGGDLPGPVRAAIGSSNVSWDEVAVFDPRAHEWRFEIEPHVFGGKFSCRGAYSFRPHDTGTVREIEVDLQVRVPFVGSRVEKVIRDGLVETMEDEASILADYLEGR